MVNQFSSILMDWNHIIRVCSIQKQLLHQFLLSTMCVDLLSLLQLCFIQDYQIPQLLLVKLYILQKINLAIHIYLRPKPKLFAVFLSK